MTWGAIGGAAVSLLGGSLLSDSSGGGSLPSYPNPGATTAEQGKENRKTFQYQLDNSRISSSNPFGRSTWKNNAVFDQAGYDRAMADFNGRRQAALSAAPTVPSASPAFAGGWEDRAGRSDNPFVSASAAAGLAPSFSEAPPDRAGFEGPSQWENVQSLSPDSQSIYDTSTSKLKEALGGLSTNADAYSKETADAIFRRLRRYQDPADELARSQQQSNLADRGFQVGNEAYGAERTRLDDSINRGVADSSDRAQIAGFTQGQQQLSMQQQIANTLQSMRDKQVAGISGLSSTANTPSLNPVDLTGLTMGQYTDAVQRNNAANASNGQTLQGLTGLINPLLDYYNKPSAGSKSFGPTLDDFYRGTGISGD
jgi:hypothetical protein